MNGRRESLPPTTGLRYRLAIRNSPGHIHLNVGRSATCSPAACRSFISFSCSVRNSRQCWYCGSFRGSGSARPFNQKSTQSTAPLLDDPAMPRVLQRVRPTQMEVRTKSSTGRRGPLRDTQPAPATHTYICVYLRVLRTDRRAGAVIAAYAIDSFHISLWNEPKFDGTLGARSAGLGFSAKHAASLRFLPPGSGGATHPRSMA